jgi:hypothetical protein
MKDVEFNTPLEKVERAAKAAVSVSPLVGTWTACDRRTNGIVRIVIAAKGAGITVQVFGACTPTPCDWGVVDGDAYAANVSATEPLDHVCLGLQPQPQSGSEFADVMGQAIYVLGSREFNSRVSDHCARRD